MPVVNITLIKGYSADARRRLATHMTNVVTQFLGAVCEGTTVMVNELDQASYMRGYENKNPAPPPPPACPGGSKDACIAQCDPSDPQKYLDCLKQCDQTCPHLKKEKSGVYVAI